MPESTVPTAPPPAPVPAPPPLPVINQFKASSAEIRVRLEAAQERVQHHAAGLRSEMTLADVDFGGMPVLDHIRRQPLRAAGSVLAGGLTLGLLWGMARRERPEVDTHEQWWEAYHQDFLDDAAQRVRKGDDPDRALRQALRRRAPVVVIETGGEDAKAARRKSRYSLIATALNTVVGFGVKLAMDRMAEKLTGTPEIMQAMEEADDAPRPGRPADPPEVHVYD